MEFHYLQFWLAFVILSGVLCLAAFAFLLARTGEDSVSGMIAQRFQSSAYIMIVALTTFCVACSALITMCGMTQIDATADPNAGHNHTFFFLAAVSPLLVLFILVFPLVVYRSDRALGFQPLDRTHTDKPMMAAYARLVIGSGVSTIDDREALNHALIWDRRKDPINIAHNGNDGGGDAEAPQQQAATRHEIGLPALSQAPAQQPPPVPTIIATTPSPLEPPVRLHLQSETKENSEFESPLEATVAASAHSIELGSLSIDHGLTNIAPAIPAGARAQGLLSGSAGSPRSDPIRRLTQGGVKSLPVMESVDQRGQQCYVRMEDDHAPSLLYLNLAYEIALFAGERLSTLLHYLCVGAGAITALVSSCGFAINARSRNSEGYMPDVAVASLTIAIVAGVLLLIFLLTECCHKLTGHERLRTCIEGLALMSVFASVLAWCIDSSCLFHRDAPSQQPYKHYYYFWIGFLSFAGVCWCTAFVEMVRQSGESTISGAIARRFQREAYLTVITMVTVCVASSAMVTMSAITHDFSHDQATEYRVWFYLGIGAPLVLLLMFVFPMAVRRPAILLGLVPKNERSHDAAGVPLAHPPASDFAIVEHEGPHGRVIYHTDCSRETLNTLITDWGGADPDTLGPSDDLALIAEAGGTFVVPEMPPKRPLYTLHRAFLVKLYDCSPKLVDAIHFLAISLGCLMNAVSAIGYCASRKSRSATGRFSDDQNASLVLAVFGIIFSLLFFALVKVRNATRLCTVMEGLAMLVSESAVIIWTMQASSIFSEGAD